MKFVLSFSILLLSLFSFNTAFASSFKTDWKVGDIGYLCFQTKGLYSPTQKACAVRVVEISTTSFKVVSEQGGYACAPLGTLVTIENGASTLRTRARCD